MRIQWKFRPSLSTWLFLALLSASLFLLYTAFYATGMLNLPTLLVERWLVGRPLTRLDCVFLEWRSLGEIFASLAFLAVISGVCLLAGYRRRVIPYLFLLLLLGTGVEVIGKKLFDLPLPLSLRSGMTTLSCPQMQGQPATVQIGTGLGMWWLAPAAPKDKQSWAHTVSQMPLKPAEPGSVENGYPSGHALRFWFIGIIASWLAWRHIRRRWLARSLAALLLAAGFTGGFVQFYIGSHFVSDTIAGYFLASALACAAIILLQANVPPFRKRGFYAVADVGRDAGRPDRKLFSSQI
ncbi:MAG: phosphatase PAP2 family protein [Ktedonobacteraceae bacterium]|nr:phosphatase PAP2 family protein [Ktedonobacteraceae bacterium]